MEKKYKHLGIDISNLILEPVKKLKEAEQSKPSTSKKPKGEKKEPELADLLGNTITEDSDDEDYVDASDDDSEPELNSAEDESNDSEEEDLKVVKPKAAPKKMQRKNSGAERLVELTKRKPGTGGVQKKKKPVAAPKATQKSATKTLQLAAAKQLAKPLQKKIGKKLKK